MNLRVNSSMLRGPQLAGKRGWRVQYSSLVALLCLLAMQLSLAPMASAQSKAKLKDVDSRLVRVERVLDQSLLDVVQRIDGLQREIRELRGEVESLTYEVETLKKRNRELYRDTNQRITDLEAAQQALNVFDPLDDGSGLDTVGPVGDVDGDPTADPGTDTPPAVFVPDNRTSGDVANEPAESVATDFGDAPKPPAVPLSGSSTRAATQAEKGAYTKAYDLLARGQNEAAMSAFDAFLREFSDGPYSDNAWYWQGEAMYAQRKFDAALRNFQIVVNSFPDSPKVPDARLKIGFALFEQQQYGKAREVLTSVQNDYPGRSAAVLARKRLQQMDRESR